MPCRTQEIQNCAIPKTRQTFEKGWKTKSEPKRSFFAILFFWRLSWILIFLLSITVIRFCCQLRIENWPLHIVAPNTVCNVHAIEDRKVRSGGGPTMTFWKGKSRKYNVEKEFFRSFLLEALKKFLWKCFFLRLEKISRCTNCGAWNRGQGFGGEPLPTMTLMQKCICRCSGAVGAQLETTKAQKLQKHSPHKKILGTFWKASRSRASNWGPLIFFCTLIPWTSPIDFEDRLIKGWRWLKQ